MRAKWWMAKGKAVVDGKGKGGGKLIRTFKTEEKSLMMIKRRGGPRTRSSFNTAFPIRGDFSYYGRPFRPEHPAHGGVMLCTVQCRPASACARIALPEGAL